MKYIYMEVESIGPDPVQYKPYSPRLKSPKDSPVYVQFSIPDTEVIRIADAPLVKRLHKHCTILTPKGFAQMMIEQALAIRQILETGE